MYVYHEINVPAHTIYVVQFNERRSKICEILCFVIITFIGLILMGIGVFSNEFFNSDHYNSAAVCFNYDNSSLYTYNDFSGYYCIPSNTSIIYPCEDTELFEKTPISYFNKDRSDVINYMQNPPIQIRNAFYALSVEAVLYTANLYLTRNKNFYTGFSVMAFLYEGVIGIVVMVNGPPTVTSDRQMNINCNVTNPNSTYYYTDRLRNTFFNNSNIDCVNFVKTCYYHPFDTLKSNYWKYFGIIICKGILLIIVVCSVLYAATEKK